MQKKCVAMLLAGGQGTRLYALTTKLAKPAVSFGSKYRIIDFPLSNCANSGIGKMGVTRVVLPDGFTYAAQLERHGVQPVSTLALRRRLAADWTRQALARGETPPGRAKIAVSAAQMSGELVRTVTELALRHRYVALDVPYGGEELCRRLRREYGVSLLLGPDKEQLEGADALVLFDPRTDLRQRNPVVLPLYDERAPMMPLSLPPALEERLPEGAGRGQLLSALMEAGVLRPGQVGASRA